MLRTGYRTRDIHMHENTHTHIIRTIMRSWDKAAVAPATVDPTGPNVAVGIVSTAVSVALLFFAWTSRFKKAALTPS